MKRRFSLPSLRHFSPASIGNYLSARLAEGRRSGDVAGLFIQKVAHNNLRAKLVLSYLGVALGAVLILAIAITLAVQNYFVNTQKNQLRQNAVTLAQVIGYEYQHEEGDWNLLVTQLPFGSSRELLIVWDQSGQQRFNSQPESDDSPFTQALTHALQGHEGNGQFQFQSLQDGRSITVLYIALPLRAGGQGNGAIIGALLTATPESYPRGFSPTDFLSQVNQAILIAGLSVGVIVVIFSLLLARNLAHPIIVLTAAAEQMKSGNYSHRVKPPGSGDELERLSVTFNAMAERIETDVNELRRQEQLRRDLIANIAHDLATPLTAIQGFSEALADDVITSPADRHETAQLIGREVQRLRRLVADMQNMTSLETGRIQLDLAPLDIAALVNETVAVMQPECDQAGILLKNEMLPTTPPVLADSDRVTQALLNLIDNARRHTPASGAITLGAQTAGNMLEVWVKDTGAGISPADLPHIFDRFYRVDRARSGATGGSGLGLAIVKAIVTAHGGSVRAQSTPGHGTCILFTLPMPGDDEM